MISCANVKWFYIYLISCLISLHDLDIQNVCLLINERMFPVCDACSWLYQLSAGAAGGSKRRSLPCTNLAERIISPVLTCDKTSLPSVVYLQMFGSTRKFFLVRPQNRSILLSSGHQKCVMVNHYLPENWKLAFIKRYSSQTRLQKIITNQNIYTIDAST